MRTALAATFIALLGTALTGCVGKLEKATRTQAATDFKCAESAVTLQSDEVYGKYHVSGCDQKGTYSAQCLMGKCSAERLRGE
jgi:hypothetical protein